MGLDLSNRHFVKELDFTPAEWMGLVELTERLKAARREGRGQRILDGKSIALIFEKTSTRTRCAFEVAAFHLGAQLTYLDPHGSQLGHKESIADTARVLGRLYDGIEFRGSRHSDCETLARYAGVPVYNGLTDTWHPTQALCDVVTMVEHASKPMGEISFAYVGDARYNMGNSLLVAGAMSGMDVRIVAPRSLWPAVYGSLASSTAFRLWMRPFSKLLVAVCAWVRRPARSLTAIRATSSSVRSK
jgi:ornithine carbamoyltransferase